MPKRKNIFGIRKIRKRRKSLPLGRIAKMKQWLHQYNATFRYAALGIVTVLGMLLVYNYQQYGAYLFKASVLEAPAPFNGTVYPVDKVPDWTHWEGDSKTTPYSVIPSNMLITLPNYDLVKLQFPSDQLEWGNSAHDVIRNTKITYPVVYLGSYELDYMENTGSHLAVDIKMPVGTPVKSIANGRVVKVSKIESGFGHHVVIEHQNVPAPDDPNKKLTLYSAFNHMDQIKVSEGQSVTKGQVIGTSGNTGTSTTPHLHFQIDRASAPWHPYWPFTWAESQAAGLSFFEAVNAALGIDNARSYTINPMKYVAKYLNYNGSSVNSGADDTASASDDLSDDYPEPDDQENTEETSPNVEETVVEVLDEPDSSQVDTSLFVFKIVGENTSMIGSGLTLTAIDEQNQINKMSDTDEVKVSISGVGRVSKKSFRKADFENNAIKFIVNSSDAGTARIEVGKSIFEITFVDQVKPIASLKIETDGHYQKGQVEVIKLIALNDNNEETPVVNFAGVINVQAKEGQATFTPSSLGVQHFKNGVAEVRMIVTNEERVVVRAQNGAIIGESEPITIESSQVFNDVSRSHANYEAIKYLEEKNIISGYPDGTFKPEKTVNRVEALKMLMLAFDLKTGPAGKLPFSDTDESAWYAGTLATAVTQAIVQGYSDGTFKPANTVNKAEYLKMLFKTNGIEPGNNLSANPYDDVPKDSWYAPYAYLTNKRNLLDVVNNRLHADQGMTRGDVAETIYRMLYVLENNLVSYAK